MRINDKIINLFIYLLIRPSYYYFFQLACTLAKISACNLFNTQSWKKEKINNIYQEYGAQFSIFG